MKHETALDTSFKIVTATATAGVRDSTMRVFYDPYAKLEIVATLQDKSYVHRGKVNVTIPQGKEIAITPTGVSGLLQIGKAGARGGIDIEGARDRALTFIDKAAANCTLKTAPGSSASTTPAGHRGWRVSVPLQGTVSGNALWLVSRSTMTPLNAVAQTIAHRC